MNGLDLASRVTHPAVQALLLAGMSTCLVLWRRPRWALGVAVLAVFWIWLASTPAVALRLREGLLLPAAPPAAQAGAIVILGGGTLPAGAWLDGTTRVERGLALWRQRRAPLLLVAGADQAHAMARGLAMHGVPAGSLRVEDRSTDTHENAVNAARMLRVDGVVEVLLVTSPIHMRRASAAFHHAGVAAIAVPSADEAAGLARVDAWLPRRDALTLTARCLHEYAASWVYRRRGWV